MTYYIREAQAHRWTPTRAATLAAAKRAAARAQMFQGTDLWVGELIDGAIRPVAVRRADALNMRITGRWVALDPWDAHCGDIEPVEG